MIPRSVKLCRGGVAIRGVAFLLSSEPDYDCMLNAGLTPVPRLSSMIGWTAAPCIGHGTDLEHDADGVRRRLRLHTVKRRSRVAGTREGLPASDQTPTSAAAAPPARDVVSGRASYSSARDPRPTVHGYRRTGACLRFHTQLAATASKCFLPGSSCIAASAIPTANSPGDSAALSSSRRPRWRLAHVSAYAKA